MSTLFTIGYEHFDAPASLIQALQEAGVRRLIDVRELPLSRKRGFSKTPLSTALAHAQIRYDHIRELGNPKVFRDLYKAGRIREGERRFRAHLRNGSHAALVELSNTLDAPTCLLCFEAAHEKCHRTVIVEALELRVPGLDVIHLQ